MSTGSQKSELAMHLGELYANSMQVQNQSSYFWNGNMKSYRLFMGIISLGYQSLPDV